MMMNLKMMMVKLPLLMMMMSMSLMTRKTTAKRLVVVDLVTSGALTFLVLAASLVTLSFLMAPVIERVFGRTRLPTSHGIKKIIWNGHGYRKSL
jgi:hypothetical protein